MKDELKILACMIPSLLILLVVSCSRSHAQEYRSLISVCFAEASLSAPVNPAPTPDVKPARRDCPDCKGTGFITHGDGHKTECHNCEPPKAVPAKATDRHKTLKTKAKKVVLSQASEHLPITYYEAPVIAQSGYWSTSCSGGSCTRTWVSTSPQVSVRRQSGYRTGPLGVFRWRR